MEKPGIVDEAIGLAESDLSLFHRRLEASKVGNVPLDEAIRCILQPIDRRCTTRDQEKRVTLARKSLGQCPPDPVACAGNDDKRRRYGRSPRLIHTILRQRTAEIVERDASMITRTDKLAPSSCAARDDRPRRQRGEGRRPSIAHAPALILGAARQARRTSRSMRAPAASSFETGASRPPQDEAARTRARSRLGTEPRSPFLFTCQTAHVSSFPRRIFCARVLPFASRTRNEGWRSAEITCGCCGTRGACLAARPGRV